MDYQMQIPVTINQTKAGLAAGTTTTITQSLAGGATANIIAIGGKQYSVAALSNTASPTTDYTTGNTFAVIPPGYGAAFVIGFDSSGNLKVIGPNTPVSPANNPNSANIVPLDASNNFINAPEFTAMGPGPSGSPPTFNNFCPIGYVVVKNAASNGSNWTFGSSNWNATGLTSTFVDCATLPGRPQVS
jgi:hypothetical protein